MIRHPDDWIGERLHGKWRLDELLGVGGVACVYAATDRQGRRVAIKLMHAHWAQEPTVRERFLREGYAANRVKHPAVIKALADGVTAEGLPFLALEYVEGRSLETELMINGRMPVDQVLDVADQVLDALGAAHDLGILHRDLKPDNLLLLHDGSIRLLDFGIARMHDGAPDDPRLTVNGRAMGTPGFMSPEQARGDWDEVDERTDVWSVGATMFALLTGKEVHPCPSPQQALAAAMTRSAPPIRDVEPTVPGRVAVIIDRALAFRPEDRWGTAAEMQRTVQHAMALIEPTRPHDEPPPTLRPVSTNPAPPSPPPRAGDVATGWRTAVVAAAAIAAAAALGTHFEQEVTSLQRRAAASLGLTDSRGVPLVLGAIAFRVVEASARVDDHRTAEDGSEAALPAPPQEVIDLDLPDPQ